MLTLGRTGMKLRVIKNLKNYWPVLVEGKVYMAENYWDKKGQGTCDFPNRVRVEGMVVDITDCEIIEG